MKCLFKFFLPIILSPISTRRLLFNSSGSVFFNSFLYAFAIEFIILNGGNEPNTPSGSGIRRGANFKYLPWSWRNIKN